MVNRFQKYVEEGGSGAPTKDNVNRFQKFAPPPEPETPEEERNWAENAGLFGLDVLRNFNDTMTFGLYNKGLEATGIDTQADEKLAASSAGSQIIGDTLGYIPGGMGLSMGLAKAVPKLAGNTIPKTIMRESASSGLLSATDDVVRDGQIDPLGVAFDSGIGGLTSGLFTAAGRLAPSARARVAGNDLGDADKLTAEYLMRNAEANGIPLTIPEALAEAAPSRGVPVQRLYDDALQAPKGSQVAQTFEAERAPKMEGIGLDMVRTLGPGATPFEVSAAAEAALLRNKQMVSNSAEPYYDAAMGRKVSPTHIPRNQPGYSEAADVVRRDKTLMDALNAEWKSHPRYDGKPLTENSALFQDAVKKELDALAGSAYNGSKPRPHMGSIFQDAAEAVRNNVDQVNPDYATARMIAAQGGERVSNLNAGPLGQVAKSPSAKGQGSIMFGADNASDAALSADALKQIGAQDPKLPRGILANNIDSAVSSDPGNWANAALPSPHARGIAMGVAPDVINDARFRAASMVQPYTGNSLPGYDGGIISPIVASIRNMGKGKIAELMQDPNFIKEFGQMGPVQKVANQAGIGLTTQPSKNRRRKPRNRGED